MYTERYRRTLRDDDLRDIAEQLHGSPKMISEIDGENVQEKLNELLNVGIVIEEGNVYRLRDTAKGFLEE